MLELVPVGEQDVLAATNFSSDSCVIENDFLMCFDNFGALLM